MDAQDPEITESVALPGPRDARGTLDRAASDARGETVVVACPPHPQYGGSRSDPRLRAVSGRLVARGIDCLRFDYGPWAGGPGERADLRAALAWARERYADVGVFGYSFGGAVAILVAAAAADDPPVLSTDLSEVSTGLDALCALSPARSLPDGGEVPAAVPSVTAPAGLVYGTRDETVDWQPTVEAARRADWLVTELTADHQFVGVQDDAADAVIEILRRLLG